MKSWFLELLAPNPEEGYKPNKLQKAALMGMVALVLISFSVANLHSILWFSSEWLVSTILPAVVTDATNSARAAEGKSPLSRNPLLDEAARLKAQDMAAKGYFAHWSPDNVSPWHWFGQAGYSYTHAGENLAVHFTDSTAVVEAWLDSPTHRDNIMNGKYTEIGIGAAEGQYEGYDTVFVVQMFGTPASSVAAVTVEEEPIQPVEEPTVEEPMTEPVVAGVAEDIDETVSMTEEGTVVYETFAATVAEPAGEAVSSPAPSPSLFSKLLTSPRVILQLIYSILGILIAAALITSMVIEWRRHHAVQIGYAAAMLIFMLGLFQLHMWASGGVLIA